ncbi:hypothetical protein UNSWDHB_1520 [Dehalobacter sp. UNSWDHB]|jgi:hypothetical protein|uniref:hypothetical protein n=1 Tax=unclassified Dehalobacter TaxID=2635733 RepID=UPI00028B9EC2|nr:MULTISPECIES: hypothetical protein [unclassified Dehalobacter]AFV03153.1 hypothetical protein DHBDCA_p2126 [Dehalobacter sp. DCA]AFV06143.1 hypothetical protein DCF50_p2140 [Dehalobacter sp. CF]EQB21132.1 hypothetical protein UNSWDHB_1520 [Dehalobacter sp. UNSWDHB]
MELNNENDKGPKEIRNRHKKYRSKKAEDKSRFLQLRLENGICLIIQKWGSD